MPGCHYDHSVLTGKFQGAENALEKLLVDLRCSAESITLIIDWWLNKLSQSLAAAHLFLQDSGTHTFPQELGTHPSSQELGMSLVEVLSRLLISHQHSAILK